MMSAYCSRIALERREADMKKSLIATTVLIGLVVAASAVVAAEDGIKRTADGKPDFTGVYDISSITPFARPKEFGD